MLTLGDPFKILSDRIIEFEGLLFQSELGGGTYYGFEAGLNDDLVERYNTGIGYQALRSNTNGYFNTGIGYQALLANTTGYNNSSLGSAALQLNTTGYRNTAVGFTALYKNITGSNNVALGYAAGKHELGSNTFYVNNLDRINTAGDKALSLIYGQMAALVADQKLTFNAEVKINGKTGLNNVAPVGMAAHIADPTDLATAITAINAILVVLENLGAVATA